MKPQSLARAKYCPQFQAGLGLIELLIVMVISLFMLAGLFAIVFGTRQNFLAQNQLAQLQDSERLAMTLITNVIQTGGYFPNPTASTPAQMLPAVSVYANAGQSIYGIAGDQIFVRYVAGTNDGVMDCNGQTNSTAAPITDTNSFYVVGNQLYCQVTINGVATPPQVLVSGVTGLAIVYGVDVNGDGSVDEYLSAANMTPANWNNVVSVQVQLTFPNPLAGTSAATAGPATLTLTRTVDLLNRT